MMKLKPCPFCGGEAKLLTHKECNTTYYGVHCEITGCCSISTLYLSEEQAIEAWNRREPIDRIVEQLEEKVIDCKEAFKDAMDDRSRDECIAIRSLRGGLEEAIEIVRGGYEEVYREEYDTAGNYHTWGTQSGHTVVKKGGAV